MSNTVEFVGGDRDIVCQILDWVARQVDVSTPQGNLARLSLELASAHAGLVYEKIQVYGLRERGTAAIRYIGQTNMRLASRLASHVCTKTCHPSLKVDWINKLKAENKVCEIVEIDGAAVKNVSEKYHIALHRHTKTGLLNKAIGGVGNYGFKHTETAKRQMSEVRKGVPLSAEHRKRISESQLGKTVSLETCENISKALTGRKLSLEARLNQSKARKGKKQNLSEEERERRRQKMVALNKNHPQWSKKVDQ